MKHLLALGLTFGMAITVSGCAASESTRLGATATTRNAAYLASNPSSHEAGPRGGASAAEAPRSFDNARSGIPIPEPAAPPNDPHMAGPVPQIPIPGGRVGMPVN
jgi:hypothetical protein